MALVVKDRVRETSTTTGTGTFTLAGAVTGYQAFSAVGDGNTTYYTIYLQGGNEWEVGIGTYTASGTTLSRDTILASSNAGSAVNFSAGVKDVFVTYPAGRSVWYDSATNVTLNALTVTGALAANGGTTIGDAAGDAFTINSSAVSTPNGLNFDSNTFVIDAANNRVGIGTNAPGFNLQVIGTSQLSLSAAGTQQVLQLNNSDTTAGTQAVKLGFSSSGVTKASVNAAVYGNDYMTFNVGSDTERARIDSAGTFFMRDGTSITNTNSSRLVVGGTISETVSSTQYLVASQFDIGTAANEIPLNQYLGNLAYQDAGSIAGQVGLSAGTAALPSLVSATDTDTGMWFPAANTLAWSTGGTRAITVTSSQNVGIGTDSPGGGARLHVDASGGGIVRVTRLASSATAYGQLENDGTNSTLTSSAALIFNAGGSSERARITSGGTFQTSLDASIYGVTVGRGAGAVATNTAVGASALAANLTGSRNTAFGSTALTAVTTGSWNIGIGSQSLQTLQTGDFNIAVGGLALATANGCSFNVAMGQTALTSNTTGSNNTGIGYDALRSNLSASNNTAVGYQAGYGNQTGTGLTFVGHQAGYASASGAQYNMGIGYQSLYGATGGGTTGIYNTAVGSYRALYNNTTGSENSAFGMESLLANTTGAYNTAIGKQALAANLTASGNTAVGYQAGYSNTTGDTMAAFGYWALKSNTTGRNTGIGGYALATNTTGTNNNAFGDSALYLNTTGSYNTAVGYSALLFNTTASFNTAVGYEALYNSDPALTNATSLTSGNNGTVYTIISVGSTDFTAIGAASNTAGITFTKSGGTGTGTGTVKQNVNALNTAIGYRSGYAITTGTKNTIIGSYNGNQGGLDIRTASNYIVLSDGDGNPRVVVKNVGEGEMTVGSQLYTSPDGYEQISAVTTGGGNSAFLSAVATAGGQAGLRLRSGVGTTYRATRIDFFQTPVSNSVPRWTIINDYDQNNTNDMRLYSGAAAQAIQVWKGDATTRVWRTLGVGNADGSTSGSGITFPATQDASSNANTLDDYEEGTWTPAVRGALTAGTYELATAEGSYVKIGKQVTLTCRVVFAAAITGGGTGYLQITGAPSFNNAAAAYGAVSQSGLDMTTNYTWLTASFISTSGTTILYLDENGDSVSSSDFPISGVTANDSIRFSITYIST